MHVVLTGEMEQYVSSQVDSGKFGSPSEVVVDALKFQIEQTMRKEVEMRLVRGEEQISQGKVILVNDEFFEKKKERIRNKYINL